MKIAGETTHCWVLDYRGFRGWGFGFSIYQGPAADSLPNWRSPENSSLMIESELDS